MALVDGGQHGLHRLDAGLDGLPGAADFLDGHGAERLAFLDAIGFLEARDLETLAAEADHDHAAHVRVGGIAPGCLLQRVEDHAAIVDHAAIRLLQRDDAVDVGVVVQNAGALDLLGDEAGDGGRAVHAGQDADIVARAGLAVGAAKTLEGRLFLDRQDVLGTRGLGDLVVALESAVLRPHVAIVLVHPVAGGDRLAGEADDLAELPDRLARGDRLDGDLVAEGDALMRRDAFGDRGAWLGSLGRDDDIVLVAQTESPGYFL